MHRNFFPTFGFDDEDVYGSPFHRRSPGGYHTRDPMMRHEERRRRAEIERYNQWKQQELLRKRREEEEVRRQRAQEEYLQRLHEAKMQEQKRRQQQRMARLGGRHQQPAYRIVRGPDGCLYRIPIEHEHSDNSGQENFRRVVPGDESPPAKLHKETDHQQMSLSSDDDDDNASIYEDCVENVNKMETESDGTASPMPVEHPEPEIIAPDSSRRRATVIVEDVPEDEDEDETKSFWRNRTPGPGESWMEPIQ